MNFKQIKETCIYIEDLSTAIDFYHHTLELPIIAHVPDKHVFFKAGTSVLLCFNPKDSKLKQSPPAHHASGPYHFAFEVEASLYQLHKDKIIQKGITVIDTVVWKNKQESFYFNDPAGNVVEIVPEGVWD